MKAALTRKLNEKDKSSVVHKKKKRQVLQLLIKLNMMRKEIL
jgi:hypothetical protein